MTDNGVQVLIRTPGDFQSLDAAGRRGLQAQPRLGRPAAYRPGFWLYLELWRRRANGRRPCGRAGIGHHAEHIEEDFDRVQSIACMPNALHQRGRAANEQRFREAELHHTEENEKEIH